jgi:hypothetical protein
MRTDEGVRPSVDVEDGRLRSPSASAAMGAIRPSFFCPLTRELCNGPVLLRIFDKRGQPPRSGLFFFRADNPESCGSLVPWRLRREKGPRSLVCAELLLVLGWKLSRFSLLIRVDSRSLRVPLFESGNPGGMHHPQFRKFDRALDIYRAPDAARLARGKTNFVADFVNAVADAIDPAKAKRTVDCLRPRNARATGIALVQANPELLPAGVIFLEPGAPMGKRWKESWLLCHAIKNSLR